MDINIVFMGSPDFALPALESLISNYSIVGVVTQPDRPSGRGRKLTPPPVKLLALKYDLPVIQPKNLRDSEAVEHLRDWAPDLIVVAAFGQILRKEVLELPKFGSINVHASLLPRWRGAAPIQSAILHGDQQTGVTIMLMDQGLDTGPILSQRSTHIQNQDTASILNRRLSSIGASLLSDTIPGYLTGEIVPEVQNNALSTYAPMLKKNEGELDFSLSIVQLERKIRALNPWPGTFTYWQNKVLKIHQVTIGELTTDNDIELYPGSRTVYQDKPAIAASDGLLIIDVVQPAGKKPMAGEVFLRGAFGWSAAH